MSYLSLLKRTEKPESSESLAYELYELNEQSTAPAPISGHELRVNELNEQSPVPVAPPRPQTPPVGSRLFFQDGDTGRICTPEEAYLWTYEGALEWYCAAKHAIPARELTLSRHYRGRCPRCVERAFRVVRQADKNGKVMLRCECGVCGKFLE